MTSKSKFRPSPATVISCVALFLALAGTAFALPKASVGTKQIANGAVRTADLAPNAVKSPKIANGTVSVDDLGDDSVDFEEIALDAVDTGEIAKGAVGSEELSENAVTSPAVAPETLTGADLATASVNSSEVANESLTKSDLGPASVGSSELGATVVRTKSEPIAAGANGTISVDCQAGEQMISGGGAPSAFGIEMATNAPSGNGWFYAASNKNGANGSITVYAVCLLP